MMKGITFYAAVIVMIGAATIPAHARVFNFDEQSWSTYLRGTFGTSNLQRNAYAPGYPSSMTYPDSAPTSQGYSGEFGFSYTSSPTMTIRVGVELLYPSTPAAATGNDGSGNAAFQLNEQAYSVIPQADFEFFLRRWPSSRFYLGAGLGYAITTFKNNYTMSNGNSFGLSSYIEEATGWGVMGQGYVGYEFAAFDTVTMSLDLGYRYLTVSNYTSNRNFTGPGGAVSSGQTITNVGGGNRFTDLSGFFSALSFRFYFY